MLYHSTNNNSERADFREATLRGQAPDKGLYFPEKIPAVDKRLISEIEKWSREEIAYHVIAPYTSHTIPPQVLKTVVAETISFNIPLVQINENIFSLELFHGPTLAFKDVGARFMSRCLGYFVQGENKKVTVLVATSGDTGGAVASGFYDVEGVHVVILYPSGKVSKIQELQLTTLGKNITALEVEGNFDDCQRMVKDAFADKEINHQLFLTSANSINVARWLPQQFYYFFAYQQWQEKDKPPVISVPSGNFGNICAGLLAYCSGLPVQRFVAACNANDVVPQYFATGNYQPRQTVHTISNAMDVGSPSNFVRMLQLFNSNFHEMKKLIISYSINDAATKQTIKDVYQQYNYLLDPHGAVGYKALHQYLKNHSEAKGFFLETAHPVKFNDVVEEVTGEKVEIPEAVRDFLNKKKVSVKITNNSAELKEFLMNQGK